MVSARSTPPVRPPRPMRRRALSASDLRNVSLQDFSDASIQVAARLRPVDGESVCEVGTAEDGKKTVIVDLNEFKFSDVLEPSATQSQVYDTIGQPLLKNFLEGYNVALMAYGHTNSGKTFSLCGTHNNPGILPRFCSALWKETAEDGQITVSFYEIYQEKVYDLLSNTRQALRVRGSEDPYVEGTTVAQISEEADFTTSLSAGWANRATSATIANDRSSRSHAVFMLRYTRRQKVDGEEGSLSSCCYFVDLAGSERIPLNGVQRDESVAINCSLSVLRRVIMARADNPTAFVGCRDSVLTRLLQNAFFGNSRTCVLATLAPEKRFLSETLATLRFAATASKVKLKPVLKLDKVTVLEQEIVKLKAALTGMHSNPQSAQFVDAKPPGIFELFPDSALNTFTSICDDNVFGEPSAESFTISAAEGQLTLSSPSGVFVNGKATTHQQLDQGDRIVIGGKRVFVALSENSIIAEMLNFYRAKNEYIEATFPDLQKRLRNEAREHLQEAMNSETEALKSVIEDLKEQVKKQAKNASQQKHLREELETYVVLQKNLQQEHEKQKSKLNGRFQYNSSTSDADVAVSIANEVLERFGKKAIFSFKLEYADDSGSVHVCLINRKQRITADLTLSEFYELKERLCDAYKTSVPDNDNLGVVERLLYSENWHWNQMDSRKSSLFNTAMLNCLRRTADARKSTAAHIRKTLAMRKSSHFPETIEEKDEVHGFMHMNVTSSLRSLISEVTAETSRITVLTQTLGNLQRIHDRLTAIEEGTISDDLAMTVAKFDALRAIERFIAQVSANPGLEPRNAKIAQFLEEMHTSGVGLAKTFDSWLYSKQQDSSGAVFLEAMKCSIDGLFDSLGRITYWSEEDQPDVNLSKEAQQLINGAMRKEMTAMVGEIKSRINRLRSFAIDVFRLLILLGDAFVVLANDFLDGPWDVHVMKNVLWPLYSMGKRIMKVKGPLPSSFVEGVKSVQEHMAQIKNREAVEDANTYLSEFLKDCNISTNC